MTLHQLHTRHERRFEANRFVYPVLSRRSGGLSIGVNLNPDKVCNFDCIYCQVDRTRQSETQFVEMDGLLQELDEMLALATSGEIWETVKFRGTPPALAHAGTTIGQRWVMAYPAVTRTPIPTPPAPPRAESRRASARNWVRMSPRVAPTCESSVRA